MRFRELRLSLVMLAGLTLIAGCGLSPDVTLTSDAGIINVDSSPEVLQTVMPTLAPELTSRSVPGVETRCHVLANEPRPEVVGRLLMSGYQPYQPIPRKKSPSYLLDLESGEQIILGQTRSETVSPDSRWLAFYDMDSQQVVVTDYDGTPILKMAAPNGKFEPSYWLDNQLLVLNHIFNAELDYDFRYESANGLILLNPFTGTQQEWLPEFQNQAIHYGYDWLVKSYLVFNPDLKYLAYPIDLETSGQSAIILWERQKQLELARIYTQSPPVWSPGGTGFVISAPLVYGKNALNKSTEDVVNFNDGLPYFDGSDLFFVDASGELKRLTYFATEGWPIEHGYSWSPSGQSIAFWLQYLPNFTSPKPVIVSLATQNVIDFCETKKLPTNQFNLPIYPPDPVWSPDENYLVITLLDQQFKEQVLLVDVKNGNSWELASNMDAKGWMVPNP